MKRNEYFVSRNSTSRRVAMNSRIFPIFLVLLMCLISIEAIAQNTMSQTPSKAEASDSTNAVLKNADIVSMITAGLPSAVILAKMNASTVDFDVSTPALIKLNKDGVTQSIITEMISRPHGGPVSSATTNPFGEAYTRAMARAHGMITSIQHPVTLIADGKSTVLEPLTGRVQAVSAFVHVLVYMVYNGTKASVRIKEKRPEISIKSSVNPGGHFYLVKMDAQRRKNTRSVKIGRGTFTYESGPDKDWCVEVRTKKLNENEWLMVPDRDMKPGEYGVFNGYQLFDFAIEK